MEKSEHTLLGSVTVTESWGELSRLPAISNFIFFELRLRWLICRFFAITHGLYNNSRSGSTLNCLKFLTWIIVFSVSVSELYTATCKHVLRLKSLRSIGDPCCRRNLTARWWPRFTAHINGDGAQASAWGEISAPLCGEKIEQRTSC